MQAPVRIRRQHFAALVVPAVLVKYMPMGAQCFRQLLPITRPTGERATARALLLIREDPFVISSKGADQCQGHQSNQASGNTIGYEQAKCSGGRGHDRGSPVPASGVNSESFSMVHGATQDTHPVSQTWFLLSRSVLRPPGTAHTGGTVQTDPIGGAFRQTAMEEAAIPEITLRILLIKQGKKKKKSGPVRAAYDRLRERLCSNIQYIRFRGCRNGWISLFRHAKRAATTAIGLCKRERPATVPLFPWSLGGLRKRGK